MVTIKHEEVIKVNVFAGTTLQELWDKLGKIPASGGKVAYDVTITIRRAEGV